MAIMTKSMCFGVALAILAVTTSANPDDDELMGVPAYVDEDIPQPMPMDQETVLANGGIADPVVEALISGPRVNGGFAAPAPAIPEIAHTNADCVGRMEGGRCVRFQNPTRIARVDDNMESPEQGLPSQYEADIHLFNMKHFGQQVMVDSPEEDHHPSEGVTPKVANRVMNNEGTAQADAASAALVPVGENMMTSGDAEMSAIMNEGMLNKRVDAVEIKATVAAIRDASGTESEATNGPGGLEKGGDVYRSSILELTVGGSEPRLQKISRVQYYAPEEARGDTASAEKLFVEAEKLGGKLQSSFTSWATGGDASAFEALLAPVARIVSPGQPPRVFMTSQDGDMPNSVLPIAMVRAQFIVELAKAGFSACTFSAVGAAGDKALFKITKIGADGAVYQKGFAKVVFDPNMKIADIEFYDESSDGCPTVAKALGSALTNALTGGETAEFDALFADGVAWTMAYPGGVTYKASLEGDLDNGVVTNQMLLSQLKMERASVGYVRTDAHCVGVGERGSVLIAYNEMRSDEAAVPVPVEVRTSGGEVVNAEGEVNMDNATPLETEDEEDKITAEEVKDVQPEPTLPPTPTAMPTPDPALIERERLAAAAKVAQMDQCIAFLAENQVQCSGAVASETVAMAEDVAAPGGGVPDEQTGGPVDKATSFDAAYDASNVKGNFQQLVLHCTGEATKELEEAESPDKDERVGLAAKLSKYASAMLCLDSDEFPECIPERAMQIIQKPPHAVMDDGFKRDKWPCW